MTFTPLVRWKNFNVENFSSILSMFPKWTGDAPVSFKVYSEFMNCRIPTYKKTGYQYVGQLGLVDRDAENVRINQYLDFSNSDQLNQYLIFWFKTYYGPNSYINSLEKPVLIYRELLSEIINSSNNGVQLDAFLTKYNMSSTNVDIIGNVIKFFGDPIEFIAGTKTLIINNLEKAKKEIDLIDTNFPIPLNYNQDSVFFNRYSEENFNKFKQLFIFNKILIEKPHNRLINGAPGTGKSHLLQNEVSRYLGKNESEYLERETFHLTYTYQQFVGTYKPVSVGNSIAYQYVAGPFLKQLVKAISAYELNGDIAPNYIFIIEEINRAKNPDAVFGGIFQLLDRGSNGLSKYEITCSEDMRRYLKEQGLGHLEKLYLPPNFYIWATMNNADQGVQAIDSAFFRRWEPEYISIDNNEADISDIEVIIKGYGLSNWNNFRKSLNNRLLDIGIKEDKLIGPFFINPDKIQSNFDEVVMNKLLRYLFEDVLKFKRDEVFEKVTHFQLIIDLYKKDQLKFIGLDESDFVI